MGIGPGDAAALSLWEYQGLLWNWNDRQPDSKTEPDFERLRGIMDARGAC